MAKKKKKPAALVPSGPAEYGGLVAGIADLLEQARRGAARAVNSILTATYWEIGRRVVEFEQGGKARAEYGERLLKRLGQDLTSRFGRGFSERNLEQMRGLYLGWKISQTPSAKLEARVRLSDEILQALSGNSELLEIPQTVSAESEARVLATAFPLSWSHYVRLMSVEKPHARKPGTFRVSASRNPECPGLLLPGCSGLLRRMQ